MSSCKLLGQYQCSQIESEDPRGRQRGLNVKATRKPRPMIAYDEQEDPECGERTAAVGRRANARTKRATGLWRDVGRQANPRGTFPNNTDSITAGGREEK